MAIKNEPQSNLNPYVRMLANDFFDRLQAAGTVRNRRFAILLSKQYGPRNYLLKSDGKSVGFFCIRKLSRSSWDFGPFGIRESQRGLGIGKAMIESVKSIVRLEGGSRVVAGIVVKQTHDQLVHLGFHELQPTWFMGLDLDSR